MQHLVLAPHRPLTHLSEASGICALIFLLSVLILLPIEAVSETIQLQNEHGTYMVPITINGSVTVPFILDTGSSEVAIPEDVFRTLIRTGTVNDTDFIGEGTYVLADGSQHASK